MKRIFVSSVQKEFERDRAAIKRMVEGDHDLHFRLIIWRHNRPVTDKQQINADKDANKNADKKINDDEVVAFVVNNASLSVKDIANKMKIKLGVMRSTIARLKREKGLVHVGSRKSGHWEFRQP